MLKQNVVVMGGGTGIYPVVSALKELPVEISAIVAASDSGGSTGRIRDEFGFPPVGDLRQSLAALAREDSQRLVRDLLLYRFQKGNSLEGHNLGNLILTALQDMNGGNTVTALESAAEIFHLEGKVIPVTEEVVQLQITYEDGSTAIGEHILDESVAHPKKITNVELTPPCNASQAAIEAIEQADLVIIGPGDYYASLMAVLVAPGLKEALKSCPAKVLYFLNLMTRITQTHNMTAQQHAAGIEQAIGRNIDHVLINNQAIPQQFLDQYAKESEFPVKDDLGDADNVIRAPLLDLTIHQTSEVDTAHRSMLRHGKDQLKSVLKDLL